jgi:hypothetical protein
MNKQIEVGKVVKLKDGRKGKVRGQLLSGEYLLASGKGGQISYFKADDVMEVENE